MKITNLPYFVKFIFSSDEGDWYQISKIDNLKAIIDNVSELHIGQNLKIKGINYEVYDIKIRHLYEDTDHHKPGLDSKACMCPDDNEWLFSILISIREVKS